MKQTITVRCRASIDTIEQKIKQYENDGWTVISKERGSWWGKIGNSYNWCIILEREEQPPHDSLRSKEEVNIVDQLVKLKGLLDAGAITQEEYDEFKKRLFK